MRYVRLLILFAIINFNLNAQNTLHSGINSEEEWTYVIKNVNVIPMTENNIVLENATVVVQHNMITSINGSIPVNAKIIDGTDKWLMPGLIDMHVHNLASSSPFVMYPTKGPLVHYDTQDFMSLYIANGVTTVFELSARPEHIGQRNEVTRGDVVGPRMALAALIDGKNANMTANSPSDGRQAVRIAKGEQYEFIKVYSNLNEETFKAIVDEAQMQNMKVVGHVPDVFEGRPAKEFFVPHFGLIAHAEELSKQTNDYSYEKAQEFARLAKENGTWLIPNLINMESIIMQAESLENIQTLAGFQYVHPLMQSKWTTSNRYYGASDELKEYFQKQADFQKLIVKAFKENNVPMVAGTDAGISGIVWGFALHDELKLLVEAGLTNEEALASATRLGAEWLEIDDKVGTIEPGKFADMILLDENPLENIENTRKISGVCVNGKWLDKVEINTLLSKVEEWNNANKEKYDWQELLNSLEE